MDIDELQKEAMAHYATIELLEKENKGLRNEVDHLKDLLTSTAPLLGDISLQVSQEQAACEIQLRMLNEKAQTRELTLEETKRLEILIKSLYLIKDKSSGVAISDQGQASIEDLNKLASDV